MITQIILKTIYLYFFFYLTNSNEQEFKKNMSASESSERKNRPIDIEKPKWDQGSYLGRARHFFTVTNPLNVFSTSEQLAEASDIVHKYRYTNKRYINNFSKIRFLLRLRKDVKKETVQFNSLQISRWYNVVATNQILVNSIILHVSNYPYGITQLYRVFYSKI